MRLARLAALAGAADTASFLATRPEIFSRSPGRAAGSLANLGLWLSLAGLSRSQRRRGPAIAAATALLAANGAMLAVHLRHRIVSRRVVTGPLLSAIALLASLRRR